MVDIRHLYFRGSGQVLISTPAERVGQYCDEALLASFESPLVAGAQVPIKHMIDGR